MENENTKCADCDIVLEDNISPNMKSICVDCCDKAGRIAEINEELSQLNEELEDLEVWSNDRIKGKDWLKAEVERIETHIVEESK